MRRRGFEDAQLILWPAALPLIILLRTLRVPGCPPRRYAVQKHGSAKLAALLGVRFDRRGRGAAAAAAAAAAAGQATPGAEGGGSAMVEGTAPPSSSPADPHAPDARGAAVLGSAARGLASAGGGHDGGGESGSDGEGGSGGGRGRRRRHGVRAVAGRGGLPRAAQQGPPVAELLQPLAAKGAQAGRAQPQPHRPPTQGHPLPLHERRQQAGPASRQHLQRAQHR